MKNWKEDKKYQQKQVERLARLQAKAGYEANIERGVVEKEEAKKQRAKRRLVRLNKKEVMK